MKINLKEQLKDLEDKDLGLTVSKALSTVILAEKTDPLRAYVLAAKIYKDEEIELNKSDFDFIKDAINKHGKEIYTSALVTGQLLMILSEFKEVKKEEVKE